MNTFRVSSGTIDTYAKERFVHHAAGIDGRGGSSYIDSMILADRDLSTGWISAADSSAEKRYYYLQNWRADTCALVNDAGMVVRNFRYSAYGSRTEVAGSDFNRDGASDFFDYLDFVDAQGVSDPRTDFNRDGTLDGFDYSDFVDVQSIDGDDLEGGSTRNLYAGYENDPSLEVPAVSSGGDSALVAWESMYHVRNRVYSTELGRWTRRDPLGYIDGMGLEEYCRSRSVRLRDFSGLVVVPVNPPPIVIPAVPNPVDPQAPTLEPVENPGNIKPTQDPVRIEPETPGRIRFRIPNPLPFLCSFTGRVVCGVVGAVMFCTAPAGGGGDMRKIWDPERWDELEDPSRPPNAKDCEIMDKLAAEQCRRCTPCQIPSPGVPCSQMLGQLNCYSHCYRMRMLVERYCNRIPDINRPPVSDAYREGSWCYKAWKRCLSDGPDPGDDGPESPTVPPKTPPPIGVPELVPVLTSF